MTANFPLGSAIIVPVSIVGAVLIVCAVILVVLVILAILFIKNRQATNKLNHVRKQLVPLINCLTLNNYIILRAV